MTFRSSMIKLVCSAYFILITREVNWKIRIVLTEVSVLLQSR
jgi:hypothetical protein